MATANKKFSLEFDGWKELSKEFEALGGDTKELAEAALKATHAYVTPKIKEKMTKGNMPAGGKYVKGSTPDVNKQIIEDINIEWTGNSATVDVGFSLDDGILPIFLIYGTERTNGTSTSAVKGLKSALYGSQTKKEVAELQEDVFVKKINRRLMNGK